MPKVSVIVPVYNTQKYLAECLDSLVNQTLDDMELIIVNDGSTDDSESIIQSYMKSYNNIKYFKQKNEGQASARNLGINYCSGDYIGFFDSDDIAERDMYYEMYNAAKLQNYDLVECDFKYIKLDNKGQEVLMPKYGSIHQKSKNIEMFFNPLVSPWNKLYKATVIKNNDLFFPAGYIYEDTSFYIKSIPYIETSIYVDTPFVKHYYRSASTMSKKNNVKVKDIFPVIKDAINYYKKINLFDFYHMELEFFCIKILLGSSLKRISKIQDKSFRNNLLDNTLSFINEEFPEYKNNVYIKKNKLSLYVKIISKKSIRIFAALFRNV